MELLPDRSDLHETTQHVVARPYSEVLLSAVDAAQTWPHLAVEHPEFLAQIEKRSGQVSAVENYLNALPSYETTVETAIMNGHVNVDQASVLYESLNDLLSDRDYERLLLYLPFEMIPERKWRPADAHLGRAITEFRVSYVAAWCRLLSFHDVAENFIAGDIPEVEIRTAELKRVVKVAELAPVLIEKGLLKPSEVHDIASSTEDPLLRQTLINSLDKTTVSPAGESSNRLTSEYTISEIITFEEDVLDIPAGTPKRRVDWLKQQRAEGIVKQAGIKFARLLLSSGVSTEELAREMPDQSTFATRIFLEGARYALLTLGTTNIGEAQQLFESMKSIFGAIDTSDGDVQKQFKKLLRHCAATDIIGKAELEGFGVRTANLSARYSENLRSMQTETQEAKRLIEAIIRHPGISTYLYPVVALGGSRLKGYGEADSDIDTTVFIKPDTPREERAIIQGSLQSLFESLGHETPIMVWLKEEDDRLEVHDFNDDDAHTADQYWSHLLFNDVWMGNEEAVATLTEKLLPSYFYAANRDADSTRAVYLERIEQDSLQYRLMHKGFERHYPVDVTANSFGEGVFWDSRFRHIATKLFVEHVFLPKLG